MPTIQIKKDAHIFPDEDQSLRALLAVLPGMVAHILSTSSEYGKISSEEIGIEVSDFGKLDKYEKPIQIKIFAKKYSERLETLRGRTDKIKKGIDETCSEIKGKFYVWVFLSDSEFAS